MPVGAYVFVEASHGKANEVVKGISRIGGVKEAHVVTGASDIISKVEASDMNELGAMIVSKIQAISGVVRTQTSIIVE